MPNERLGSYIKEKRENLGISQRELARRIDIDNKTLNSIEKGLTKKVALNILIKISNELKLNIIKLLKLSNYTKTEINGLFNIPQENYSTEYLINYFKNIDDIDMFCTIKEDELIKNHNIKYIDIMKVLKAYKNNQLSEKQTIALITACKPKYNINDEIYKIEYVTENENIIIEL